MKSEVTFNQERCKGGGGCGLCISFCPKKILAFDTSVYNASGVTANIKDQEARIDVRSAP